MRRFRFSHGENAIEYCTRPVPASADTNLKFMPRFLSGPQQALVRISAQRYNRQEEYARLAESLARRLRGPASPRALLGRLRKT